MQSRVCYSTFVIAREGEDLDPGEKLHMLARGQHKARGLGWA